MWLTMLQLQRILQLEKATPCSVVVTAQLPLLAAERVRATQPAEAACLKQIPTKFQVNSCRRGVGCVCDTLCVSFTSLPRIYDAQKLVFSTF